MWNSVLAVVIGLLALFVFRRSTAEVTKDWRLAVLMTIVSFALLEVAAYVQRTTVVPSP